MNLTDLFRIRMGTDVLANVMPAGVLVAEPLRPALLCKRFDVPWSEAVASAAISKVNIALAQGAFFLCGLILLDPLTYSSSDSGVLTQQGVYIVFGAISLLIPLALLFYKGRLFGTIRMVVEKFPLGDSLHKKVVPFIRELEGIIGTYAREMVWRMLASLCVFFLGWLCLAGESFLILQLLGVDVSFAHAILLESTASIVRLLFFFVPATLGTQEAGFVLFFTGLGYHDPLTTSAAFIILKRTKDICWSLLGFCALSFLGVSHAWRNRA